MSVTSPIPARVVGQLWPSLVTLVLFPGRICQNPSGKGFEWFTEMEAERVPVDLRKPNTDVWIIGDKILPRTEEEYSAGYLDLPGNSSRDLPRFDDYQPRPPQGVS
jgi:hypothetical protein